MLSYARQRISLARVPMEISQASAEKLPLRMAGFDCVVATLVFLLSPGSVTALQEVRRVLKRGSVLADRACARPGAPGGIHSEFHGTFTTRTAAIATGIVTLTEFA